MQTENIQKAIDDLGFVCEELEAANKEANAVEHIVILDCLEAAHKLHQRVSWLMNAIKENHERSAS